jgi:hypothetical protein
VSQGAVRGRQRVVYGQLDVCRLAYVDVLCTIDVDSVATSWTNNEVAGVKGDGLRLIIWIIPFDALLNEDSSPFESINQLLLVFLLYLRKRFNPLPPLFLQEYVLRVRHLHKLLSRVKAAGEGIFIDDECKLRLLDALVVVLERG